MTTNDLINEAFDKGINEDNKNDVEKVVQETITSQSSNLLQRGNPYLPDHIR